MYMYNYWLGFRSSAGNQETQILVDIWVQKLKNFHDQNIKIIIKILSDIWFPEPENDELKCRYLVF